jgi:hypothetical protein
MDNNLIKYNLFIKKKLLNTTKYMLHVAISNIINGFFIFIYTYSYLFI